MDAQRHLCLTMPIARLDAAPGPLGLRAAVAAFAAGHEAVLLVTPGMVPDAAFLALAEAELSAPMTTVVGPGPGGTLALLGLTELVPGLLALDAARADAASEAVRVALEADLAVVVLPEILLAGAGVASPEPLPAARRVNPNL